ncbi:MAG: SMI1/KNR4 family protein [Acetatifactor sp.]|nr:SMI1/KNR4 family protein [Acetatifactor sp.]
MKYYKKAKEIMDMDAVEFIGGVSESDIENAMRSLSVDFPESYKAFLSDLGGGDVGGEIIFGITDDEEDVVKATQMERSQGLPENLVIIGFWNDTLVCLDTDRMDSGECPVVEVEDDYSVTEVIADTFGKFLYEYLDEE